MSSHLRPTPHKHNATVEQPPKGNLPVQLTPFVGREEVKRDVIRHLLRDDVRLLTLIGPPGIGKTRLSLAVAADAQEHFDDGVWFVSLALVTDPLLVPSSIAHALGLKQAGGRALADILHDFLLDKHLLLVLDNFEQVVEAAPFVAELLSAALGVKALVTSREALRVRGEQEYAVPPLTLPNLNHLPSAEQASRFEAVQLFAQRARSANLDFRITDENALVVAAICWRLDGLPLAIELAAARTKLLPPQALFERLGQSLAVLTGGARDLPPRHRTLRNAIDWSYNLLDANERAVFRRMGVFVGGCKWDAVDAVCNADGIAGASTLDVVAALVDKSLVQQTRLEHESEPRLILLETLKEYALDQLEEKQELAEIRRQHALYFLGLAELWNQKAHGQGGPRWLQLLDEEHDNLRAALKWACSETRDGHLEADIALRLGVALFQFWAVRGYVSEGRDWLVTILDLPGAKKYKELQVRALAYTSRLTYIQCDYGATRSYSEEYLKLSREIGYKWGIAFALETLAVVATEHGDYISASADLAESLALARELPGDRLAASVLNNLGFVALRTGNYAAAVEPFEESLALYTQRKEARGLGHTMHGLGETSLRLGNYDDATEWFRKSLVLREELGDKWGRAISLANLGWVAYLKKDYAHGADMLCRSLALRREMDDIGGLAWCMEKLSDIAREQGQLERAVRLFGAAKTLRDSIDSVIDPADQPDYDRTVADMRARMGDAAFAAAWAVGAGMTTEEALQYAVRIAPAEPADAASQLSAHNDYDGLTRREWEVASLIAQSKSNAEIAETLVVSKRTVETHITNILSKLNFTSRGQLAAWAINKKMSSDRN